MRNNHVNYTVGSGETFKPVLRWGVSALTAKAITGITQAAPAVVTSTAHGMVDGWDAAVESPAGMTQIGAMHFPPAGQDWHPITLLTANTVQLNNVNSAGYSAYTAGGFLIYNAPKDLTGATARMVITDAPVNGNTLMTLTEIAGIVIDNVAKTITPTFETSALTWTLGYFHLDIVISGRTYRILTGTIALTSDGTGAQPVLGVTVIDGV